MPPTMNNNGLSREDRLSNTEEATGYIFTNPELCLDALRTAGYTPGGGHKGLAQVGDAALRLVLVMVGYEKGASREQINDALRVRASNIHLARQGFEKCLEKCVYRTEGVVVSQKIMATTVQAVLGAVYIDCEQNTSVFQGVIKALGLSWPEK
ncbi:RNAse III, variant [Blastomyces gilchristii SLH14081]|uniref:RNAse III n=1 Tax=Blastomyces gilchristii (strain SLH14081) TaxID=559298 RepID=A0A179UXW7_BLAGS|nr:RNAse III, variant [Blastomyces gilchristii SLH14081]XP_031580481.1 RNAse III [Blastomyces gilchristii SLH14081]OAT12652.1 RNAse III [Blastomyces gilchristii SLH14081]OAT12653.1 RNAse III, variant [Blastomyces gilchristii SLH14081]